MSGRILTLDFLRGYFLFVIIIDHLFRFPGIFEAFTGRGQLWVSAAEGFFIISGLLVGLIYTRSTHSLAAITKKLYLRAGKLYLWSILLTYLFTVWGYFLPLSQINYGLWTGPLNLDFFTKVLTFQYIYGWADYLAYYVLFLLVSPLVIFLLRRNLPWLIIILSLALWFIGRSSSIYLAWQPLFVGGLLIGAYLPQLEKILVSSRRTILLLSVITLATIILSSITSQSRGANAVYPPFFDKNTLGLGRLSLSWIWFGTAYLLVRRHEHLLERITGGFFTLYGKNSLFVYGLHAVLIFPINVIIPNAGRFLPNVLVNISVLLCIYLITLVFSRLAKKSKTFA